MATDENKKKVEIKAALEAIPVDIIAISLNKNLVIWNNLFSTQCSTPNHLIEAETTQLLLYKWIQEAVVRVLHEAEVAAALQQALMNNEFELYYQPLVDLKTDNIIGVEALIRWNHPTLGVLYPNSFISLAETTGLIFSLGEWVLKTACKQALIWQKTISPHLNMAVNISGYQLRDENFVNTVNSILEKTGFSPQYLELEVTENVIAQKIPEIAQRMAELKSLGINLSIDDFGTEYASLSYIKYFPFDKVKIAKIFIDGIVESDRENYDTIIIEAIINMTKKMGMKVLAEGVERIEQVEFLRKHHSDQVQGYYFSEPLTLEKCTALLARRSNSTPHPSRA